MPDKQITDAVEEGVDRALAKLQAGKGTWVKVLAIVVGALVVGYALGASFGMPM